MRLQIIAILSLTMTGLQAQTKEIAFESHSGNLENFHLAIHNELFDHGESGFGLPANKTAYKLDSVIFLNDSASVLVSREYSRPWSVKTDSLDKFVAVRKDTVYSNQLFSRKYLLDSLRKMMGKSGPYETTNKTEFVGFDKIKGEPKNPGKKQEQFIPLFYTNDPPDDHSTVDRQLLLMLGSLLFLSLLGGWISWRFYQPRWQ